MRALLVQGISPPAYWGYAHGLPFIGKAAQHLPLGLAAEDVAPRLERRLAEIRTHATGAIQRGIAAGPAKS